MTSTEMNYVTMKLLVQLALGKRQIIRLVGLGYFGGEHNYPFNGKNTKNKGSLDQKK